MASRAEFKFVRIAPSKIRAVAGLVRGKRVEEAMDLLRYNVRRSATPLLKLIKSAVANADQTGKVDVDRLYVKSLQVNEGPRVRRARPRSRGMANPVVKAISHIVIELGEK